jgi:phosphoglycolate phosphatase
MSQDSVFIGIDLDGTLEDSRVDMVAAARRVRAQLDLPVRADELLRPHVNAGMEQLYRACFDDYLAAGEPSARFAQVQAGYEADYLAHVADETRLYPGIEAALHGLAPLATLACITNKPERISRKLLEQLGVGACFATVVGGDTCVAAKPHPVMLRAAIERSGVQPAQVFMVGDSAADQKLAAAFGARFVWCAWGYVSELDVPEADIARAPADLVGIIERG